jgi:hypothetical protein
MVESGRPATVIETDGAADGAEERTTNEIASEALAGPLSMGTPHLYGTIFRTTAGG